MKSIFKFFKFCIKLGLVGVFVALITAGVSYMLIWPSLPDVEQLKDVQLQVPLRVYSRDGELMAVFGEKRRSPTRIDQMPEQLKQAFIAGEDARFYEHPGFDYQGILRAVWNVVKTGGDRGIGGSTITQQLARDFGFVSRKKLYTRKLKEIFLALKIEQELGKDEILELYLNKIYLGERAYGVAAAAQAYYGKNLEQLSLSECATLASLPKAPSRINPIKNPQRSLERRNYVLGRMNELGYVNDADYQAALSAEDFAFCHEPTVELSAPYAAEMVRNTVTEMLGEDAYNGGYEVYTTFDSRLQQTASQSVRKGLVAYDQRHGYRGPESQFELKEGGTPEDWQALLERFEPVAGLFPALIVEVEEDWALAYLNDGQTITLDFDGASWARPYVSLNSIGPRPETLGDIVQPGDVVRVTRNFEGNWQLTQIPEVQGALVSMDVSSGAIRAITGGFDFQRSKFNRAIQAKRQPGSSFKPFMYAAAFNNGFTPATLINDAPVVFDDPALERVWRPQNYSEEFFGPTRLRDGVINSRNLVSIRVLREMGVKTAWDFIQRFGFNSNDIPQDLTMALGSGSVEPVTMARAYAVIANGGFLIEPHFIEKIVDGQGQTVFEAQIPIACAECTYPQQPEDLNFNQLNDNSYGLNNTAESNLIAPKVLDDETRFIVTHILQDVIKFGTGKKALELKRSDLAGKTGTTNEQRDAWFSGFNHRVVTSAWVGFDDFTPLGRGEVGGRAALPIWIDYMREALVNVPEQSLEPPPGIVFARVDRDSGLLTTPGNPNSIIEVFRRGSLPQHEIDGVDTNINPDEESVDPYEIF